MKRFLLIVLAAVLTYLLKPFRFTLLDLAFLLYSIAVFNLQRKHLTSSLGLFVALPHALFGTVNLVPLTIALGVSVQLDKVDLSKRFELFLKYYCVYAASVSLYIRAENLGLKTILMSVLPFALLSLVDFKSSKLSTGELLIVAVLAWLYSMGLYTQNWWILIIFALLFLIYVRLVDYHVKLQELVRFRSTYEEFRRKLAALVDTVNRVSQTASIFESLNKIAETISDLTGFKYVLISVLNRELGLVQRVAHHGLSEEEFKRLKENPPPIDYVFQFTQERFRISNSYFVPEGTLSLPSQYVATLLDRPLDEEPDAWRPEDMLIVPIRNAFQEMVGYISLDAPQSGKRPRLEDIQIVELLADQVYKLLERSELYHDIVIRRSYDTHTLLLTHSAFLTAVETEIARANRFAIVILDVDDLSQINQRFGHETGDRLLEKIADVLRTRTRKTDVAARYGGEEFALLLRNVTKAKAVEITDRLLQEVRRLEFVTKVSVSAGIALFPEHGKTTQELIKAATHALQVAKVSGKDRLMIL